MGRLLSMDPRRETQEGDVERLRQRMILSRYPWSPIFIFTPLTLPHWPRDHTPSISVDCTGEREAGTYMVRVYHYFPFRWKGQAGIMALRKVWRRSRIGREIFIFIFFWACYASGVFDYALSGRQAKEGRRIRDGGVEATPCTHFLRFSSSICPGMGMAS